MEIRPLFAQAFQCEPLVVVECPGRIEILGNHTDYNEGFALSAAIDRTTIVALAESPDRAFRLHSANLGETVTVHDPAPSKAHPWINYILGVYDQIARRSSKARPFSIAVHSTIPVGAGLSSSAALEVATAFGLMRLFGIDCPPHEVALLCQRAEREFAGAQCGLLDQYSVLFGKRDHLLTIDFRTLGYHHTPIPPTVRFVNIQSGVKHAHAEIGYNDRHEECRQATESVRRHFDTVQALRDITMAQLHQIRDSIDPALYRRALHVVGENERVAAGERCLRENRIGDFGELMFQSHESSRINFENSCAELDTIVMRARSTKGVLGARLSGGGFGGSAIALIDDSCDPGSLTGSSGAQIVKVVDGVAFSPET